MWATIGANLRSTRTGGPVKTQRRAGFADGAAAGSRTLGAPGPQVLQRGRPQARRWSPAAPQCLRLHRGGGEDEVSLRRNRASFDDWTFVPRWGSVAGLDLGSALLGGPVALPLDPVADRRHPALPSGWRDRGGPCRTGRGIPYGLAHLSTTSMEQVSASAPLGRRWFNLEPMADKTALQALLDRVARAGYEALLVNVDCRDHRPSRARLPQRLHGPAVHQAARPSSRVPCTRPGALGFLRQGRHRLPQPRRRGPRRTAGQPPAMWRTLLDGAYEPTDWSDLSDLRARWHGPIVLKGCVNPGRRRHRRRPRHRRHPGQQPRRSPAGPHGLTPGRPSRHR